MLSTCGSKEKGKWYFDSGVSVYMTKNSNFLMHAKTSSGTVVATNGENMQITAKGSCVLKSSCQKGEIPVDEVQLISNLSVNLLSVNQIVKKATPLRSRMKDAKWSTDTAISLLLFTLPHFHVNAKQRLPRVAIQ